MDHLKKSFFLNPVLSAPWRTQKTFYEKPFDSTHPLETEKIIKIKSENRRTQNMELLLMRFPGLKKYQARAALTMSANKLEKAIILLEVSHSFRKEIIENNNNVAYLKNVDINISYDSKKEDPNVRNIILKTSVKFKAEDSSLKNVKDDTKNTALTITDQNHRIKAKNQKIGVIITKTLEGYKATTFEEKYYYHSI